MQFQNPWGALAFLLIPVLIIIYMLKQRYREETVSSTVLWQRAANQWEASHPWQKWRRSLLFFLQLIALCCLILAFMRPVWRSEGLGQNTVMVIDLSLSMQAEEDGTTRLSRAQDRVREFIGSMQQGERMSIVLAGYQNELLIANSDDKAELLSVLDRITAQYGTNGLMEAVQLARSVPSENENEAAVYLLTDHIPQLGQDSENSGAAVINVAENTGNTAMGAVSYSRNSEDGSIDVLGSLQNYSGEETVSVELWCDGELTDIKDVSFKGEAMANVIFNGVDAGTQRIMLALSREDALLADNYSYCVVQDNSKYRILLQTERNIFLEKAILLRGDVELYKSNPGEEFSPEDYDLLIAEDWTDGALPETQNLWLINPGSNHRFEVLSAENGSLSLTDTELSALLFSSVEPGGISFAKANSLLPEDNQAVPIMRCGEEILVLAEETENGKMLAMGFDLHNTNLPMLKDFPIMVQNILAWYLPVKEGQLDQITAHEPMPVFPFMGAESYDVTLPDTRVITNQTQPQFVETDAPGFYTVARRDGQGQETGQTVFAVNPYQGAGTESNLYTAGAPEEAEREAGRFSRLNQFLPALAILALAVMLIEWWVYHRGR